MRILDFFIKKRDASLIEKFDLYEFLETLTEEEIRKFKQYSELVFNENKIKIKDFENKTTVTFRAVSNSYESESESAFFIRSATDFMADVGEVAVKDENFNLAEKILNEAIKNSKNDFDMHYSCEKMIKLYDVMIENNLDYLERYMEICQKDIEVFAEIRKSSHHEYVTIAKRSYKAAIISEDEYNLLMKKAKSDIILPLANSFKVMIELCIVGKKFDKALELINRGLCYDIPDGDRKKLEYLLEKTENARNEYEKQKVDERIKRLEDKIAKDIDICKNETEDFVDKLNLNQIEKNGKDKKNIKYLEEISKLEKEILQNEFLKNNNIESAKEKLIKIVSFCERERYSNVISVEIFLTLGYIYYYENSSEKAVELLKNYLNIVDKSKIEQIKKVEKIIKLIEIGALKKDYVFKGADKEEYKALLNMANEEYKNKNYEKAVILAKKAKEISDSTDIYPNITEALKLPMYLQKAKCFEEAWRVYNELLEERVTDENDFLGISKIYDKIRIQLQSEKKFRDAMINGIYSYMWDAAELNRTGNTAQYDKYTLKVELIKLAESFLKKMKQESVKEKVVEIVSRYIVTLPKIDRESFEKEIKEWVREDRSEEE